MSAASSPLDDRGLRNRVTRIDRIVTNVRDLDRAVEFWEAVTPLRRAIRTTSTTQDIPSLGVRGGSFDGWILQEPVGGNPFGVHLVQWHDPAPTGQPYEHPFHTGWYRIAVFVPDIDIAYRRVLEAGGAPYAEPALYAPRKGAPGSMVFGVPDPDGIAIQFVGRPGVPERINHVAGTTPDVDATRPFYTHLLGLDFFARTTSHAVPNTVGPGGGEAAYDVNWFRVRGDERFAIDHVEWLPAGAFGEPYDFFAHPSQVGYVRLSLEVDDIDAVHAYLAEWIRTPAAAGCRTSDAPEEWDLGDVIGRRRVILLTDPDGVGFELIQQAPFPTASESRHPFVGEPVGSA
jgi:catechol 2,3-dioxygenase-like lactoylglutathione lyase family enzyme